MLLDLEPVCGSRDEPLPAHPLQGLRSTKYRRGISWGSEHSRETDKQVHIHTEGQESGIDRVLTRDNTKSDRHMQPPLRDLGHTEGTNILILLTRGLWPCPPLGCPSLEPLALPASQVSVGRRQTEQKGLGPD